MGFPGDGATRLPDQGQKRKNDDDHGMGSKINAIENTDTGGNMVQNAEGGMVINRCYDWSLNKYATIPQRICKRMIVNTNVLTGHDGLRSTYTSSLVLPFNIAEFWLGDATLTSDSGQLAPAVKVGTEGLFRFMSCKARISNLQIYEDTLSVSSGQEVTTSANNHNIYAMILGHTMDNFKPLYNIVSKSLGAAIAVDDNTFDPCVTNDFMSGQICNKSNGDELNSVDNVEFWRPGDPPKEYNVPVDSSKFILSWNTAADRVRQLPMVGDSSFGPNNATYTVASTNTSFVTKKGVNYNNPPFSAIKIGLPKVFEVTGSYKKFRLSLFVETECIIEKRANYLQNTKTDKYLGDVNTTLLACLITDVPSLNPPICLPGYGKGYMLAA